MKKHKETSKYLELLAKTSIFVFLSLFIAKLLAYVYKIFIARFFGANVYGIFSLALVVLGIVATTANLGLVDGLLRYVSHYRGTNKSSRAKQVLKISIISIIFAGIVASILLFLLSDYISLLLHKPELASYLRIMSISIPFMALSGAYLAVIRAFENIQVYSFTTNVLQNLLKLILLILIFLIGFETNSIAISYTISFFLLAVISYYFSRKYLSIIKRSKNPTRKEEKIVSRELFSYSYPFIFTGLLSSLFYSTDSLILGYFNDASTVGVYNVAITIATLFFIAPELFMQLFLPLISKKLSEGKIGLIENLSRHLSKWIFIINLPFFVLVILFPGIIINLLGFGPEYLLAGNSLRILAIGAIFSGFVSMLTGLISMKGLSKLVLVNFAVFTILNAILSILLVPKYGMVGASIATTISWILFTISLTIQVKKNYSFSPFKKDILKIIFVTLLPLGILLFIKANTSSNLINIIFAGILFGLSYLFTLFVAKSLDEKDVEVMKSLISKLVRNPLRKRKYGANGEINLHT